MYIILFQTYIGTNIKKRNNEFINLDNEIKNSFVDWITVKCTRVKQIIPQQQNQQPIHHHCVV